MHTSQDGARQTWTPSAAHSCLQRNFFHFMSCTFSADSMEKFRCMRRPRSCHRWLPQPGTAGSTGTGGESQTSANGGEKGFEPLWGGKAPNRFRVEIINQQLSFNQTVAPFSPFDSYSGIPPVTDVLCSGLLQFLYAAALRSLRGQCTWMYKCCGRQDAGSSSQ